MSVEHFFWIFAVAAFLARWVSSRMEAHRLAAASGMMAVFAFALGALFWMFEDTYAHYFGVKENCLRISYWGSYREHEMWKEIVRKFEKKYPDIQVKQEYITDRYEDKIQQLLLADAAPDVILFQDEPMPRFISSGKFEPLDSWRAKEGLEARLEDYWETSVTAFQENGITYGMPIWGGDCLIIYNRTAFQDAGLPEPPSSWNVEEFLQVCQQLTGDDDGDGRLDRYGFMIPSWVYWLPFHYAFGATYLDPTREKWTLWGPEAQGSYDFWQGLRHTYHVAPHRDELTEGGSVAFMTGRVAMFVSGPWAMPPFNEAGVDFDIAPMPSGPGGHGTRVTWDCLAMFAGSKRKEQAWRFIHFATSLPAQEIVAEFQRSVPALKEAKDAFIQGNPNVRNDRFVDAFSYARVQPITEHWSLMSREVSSETDLMLDNRQSVEETLEHLAINPHLREHFRMPRIGKEEGP